MGEEDREAPMHSFARAFAALIAPFILLACKPSTGGGALEGELAQSDPGAAEPQPGTGFYDAGLLPTPGTSPRPTDPSIGPSESPTMPTNPGTDPAQGYPAPPGENPNESTAGGAAP
jgi:hypothetical protein